RGREEGPEPGVPVGPHADLGDGPARVPERRLAEERAPSLLVVAEPVALQHIPVRLAARDEPDRGRDRVARDEFAAELPVRVTVAVEVRIVALEQELVIVAT